MPTDINIRTFTGAAAAPYIPLIARLRLEVFREYPYLRDSTLETELVHLKTYTACREAVVVVVFDGSKIVGASTGIPLECEPETVRRPFLERLLSPASFYYFSESALLKQYRRRGIAHHFFDLREQHARSLRRFDHICFCALVRPENDPRKPPDYLPLYDFWRKRGCVQHPDMRCSFYWKETGEEKPSEKEMIVWTKELSAAPFEGRPLSTHAEGIEKLCRTGILDDSLGGEDG
jgi:GNAT superfamily N-acetyltransferase